MILYIDEPFTHCEANPPDVSYEDLEFQADDAQLYRDTFERFAIRAHVDNIESRFCVTIYPQKIALDDINMNTLFANVMVGVFYGEYTLEYSSVGGVGCEFAMRMRRI